MKAGTRVDHNRFCLVESWDLVRDARGRAVGHHVTYELLLIDGSILRTRISRPVNTETYGRGLWRGILHEQLAVTEEEFWACVLDERLPNRGQVEESAHESSLPAGLVYQLIHVARLEENEVRQMTLDQAITAMATHWSKQKPR